MPATRVRRWGPWTAALLVIGLAGCPRAPQTPSVEPSVEVPPGTERVPAGATLHRIDAVASRVAIEVFRGGPLASMGHNHVVNAPVVTGEVYLAPQIDQSAFDLQVPLQQLVVDDPHARREAGDQFPPDLPPGAREATRANMLGPRVLEAERYPQVRIHSVAVTGELPRPRIVAAIELHGVSRTIELDVEIEADGDRLRMHGAFLLRQSEFGITPFSVALGSLTVQDEVRVRFDLTAAADPAN